VGAIGYWAAMQGSILTGLQFSVKMTGARLNFKMKVLYLNIVQA
jgi:hypothetical protein